jgi:predicted nucleotidyltransferase component of viral defense system
MKDYIREIIKEELTSEDNKNRVREYLQKYLLYVLYRKKIYKDLIFCGGTALRFLYKIRRFSEDLDFILSFKAKDYNFENILNIIKNEFKLSGYNLEIKYKISKNVHSAFLKFSGILFEYGISPHKDEKLSIKIEIDTNPPEGGKEKLTLYNSTFMFYIFHYDLPSLFAGKLHALLCRDYTKGRDWYDLLWYLTKFKNLEPNFILLNNALQQTHKGFEEINQKNWKKKLRELVETVDIEKIKDDIYRFLEDHTEIEFLTKENLYNLLV